MQNRGQYTEYPSPANSIVRSEDRAPGSEGDFERGLPLPVISEVLVSSSRGCQGLPASEPRCTAHRKGWEGRQRPSGANYTSTIMRKRRLSKFPVSEARRGAATASESSRVNSRSTYKAKKLMPIQRNTGLRRRQQADAEPTLPPAPACSFWLVVA